VPRLVRFFTICAFLVCAYFYCNQTIVREVPVLTGAPTDFLPYYQAAQHITRCESPYLADGYIYPPLLAFALTPLTRFDYRTARRIWFGLSQGLLIASAILLWWAFGRGWLSATWIALVWAKGGAAAEALGLGQVEPLLILLIVLALTNRSWLRSAAIGGGFALKLFPGLLGVAVLLRRERRGIQSMAAFALAALLLPWTASAILHLGPGVLSKGSAWMGTPGAVSWSLVSIALRLLDPHGATYLEPRNWMLGTNLEHFSLPPGLALAGLAISLVTLAVGLFALVRLAGPHLNEKQMPWAISALVTLALLASPVAWSHYQALEYPGVALLLIDTTRTRQWKLTAFALALAVFVYPLPIHMMDWLREHWTAESLGAMWLWTTVPAIASMGLFGVFVMRAARLRARRPPSPNPASYIPLRVATPPARLHAVPQSPLRDA
jgi:hypothetical protein